MIPFNIPALTGREQHYLRLTMENRRFCGDGPFSKQCEAFLQSQLNAPRVLLTTSCTHALEMAALLLDLGPGDEVVMPSYTFVSSANAFALRGAKIVFVDINPDTMNMDPACVRAAITARTKAIVPVHYAGVGCKMEEIVKIAQNEGIRVVEDAAQGIMSRYNGRQLGTIGDLGCISFHETKNIHCGEGGALVINDPALVARAEIIREKGTDRSRFLRGLVDKYTWVDIGSSYVPSELNAAFLIPQLEDAQKLTTRRLEIWRRYHAALCNRSGIEIPHLWSDDEHNAHMFWIKARNRHERDALIDGLRANGIQAPFHYIPLHLSDAGKRFGSFCGEDRWTTQEAEKLLRLPLYADLSMADQDIVISVLQRLIG